MSDIRWLQFVTGLLDATEKDAIRRECLHGRLKATLDYQTAYSQFQSGASERVLTMLLHGEIRRLDNG